MIIGAKKVNIDGGENIRNTIISEAGFYSSNDKEVLIQTESLYEKNLLTQYFKDEIEGEDMRKNLLFLLTETGDGFLDDALNSENLNTEDRVSKLDKFYKDFTKNSNLVDNLLGKKSEVAPFYVPGIGMIKII